jgi:hypothetical protein
MGYSGKNKKILSPGASPPEAVRAAGSIRRVDKGIARIQIFTKDLSRNRFFNTAATRKTPPGLSLAAGPLLAARAQSIHAEEFQAELTAASTIARRSAPTR